MPGTSRQHAAMQQSGLLPSSSALQTSAGNATTASAAVRRGTKRKGKEPASSTAPEAEVRPISVV